MKTIIITLLLVFSLSYNAYGYKTFGGENASTLEGQSGSYYTDSANLTGAINYSGISNWDTAVGEVKADTGVDEHEAGVDSCEVTINAGDNTKIDIFECNVHIQGPHYHFDGITSLDPQFAAGKNSRYIGVTMNGYTSQTSRWSSTQKLTIIPLARLNAPIDTLGPGSEVHLVRDDRYFLTKRDYYDLLWHEEAIGALYVTGGDIFANATSGLILGQNAGVLYDAQTKRHTLAAFENESAIFLHLSSNETDWVASKKSLVVDAVNYNPAGSSLVPMLNDNTFKADTIMKSPKGANGVQEGHLFIVYGDTEYATAADAIANAETRFSLFVNQYTSRLVPVALIVQQKNAAAVDTIIDKRPCFVCRP